MEQKLSTALSIAIQALCKFQYHQFDDRDSRGQLYDSTIAAVREIVGEDHRLTSMPIACMCCGDGMGEKEGNGSIEETSTICWPCMDVHYPNEARIMRELEVTDSGTGSPGFMADVSTELQRINDMRIIESLAKPDRREDWHRKFAWWPVKVEAASGPNYLAWMEWTERKGDYGYGGWSWRYREPLK